MAKKRYRHQLHLVDPGTPTRSGIGAPTDDPDSGTEFMGDIEPVTGGEVWLNDRENNEVEATIRCRYDESLNITAKKTIEHRNVSPVAVYDIVSVINHKQKDHELLIRVKHRT